MLSENKSAYSAVKSESGAKIAAYNFQNRRPFQRSRAAEPPVAESGAASGTERTTVHRQEQGWKQITNETLQEGYLHILKEDFLLHLNSKFSFWHHIVMLI